MISSESIELIIEGQKLSLLAKKALFWENERGLIISDVHLGKAGHFRKHGIALPQSSNDENLDIIDDLIQNLNPKWILFLGDLFHSDKNEEWLVFRNWRDNHRNIEMYLVMGNHEILSVDHYEELGIKCMNQFQAGPFLFLHDKEELSTNESFFSISGHIHPAVKLKGRGRQKFRIPCFYFEKRSAILPAFGTLTGTYTINPSKNAQVYGIIDHQILQIH